MNAAMRSLRGNLVDPKEGGAAIEPMNDREKRNNEMQKSGTPDAESDANGKEANGAERVCIFWLEISYFS